MLDPMYIPNSDLRCSRIGLGTARIGLRYDRDNGVDLLNEYLYFGGNLIDTARVYSDWIPGEVGRSERIIGDWLRKEGKRNQIILMTKGGHPLLADHTMPRMTASDMETDLNLSPQALGTDFIDIYFYHRDDPGLPVGQLLEVMESFRRAGKIRYYACSNWSTTRMQEADRYASRHILRGFIANQALFNLGSRHMNPPADTTLAVLDQAMQTYHEQQPKNLAIAYSANANGFFSKLLSGDPELLRDSPYFTEANLALAYNLSDLCEKYQATPSQLALGYVMTRPFPCIPLTFCSTLRHLGEVMRTQEIVFDPRDFDGLFT